MKKILLPTLILISSACAPLARQASYDEIAKYTNLINQGTVQLLAHDLDNAQATFEVASQIERGAESLDGLGCVAAARNDYQKAEQYFIEAYEADSEYYTALSNLADLYQKLGRISEAEALYRNVISNDPSDFRARNNLGVLLLKQKRYRSAKKEIQRSQAIISTPITVRNISELSDVVAEQESKLQAD